MADEAKYSKHVEGEHFETAQALKEESLVGPSEAELSEALVSAVQYVPPEPGPELFMPEPPKPKPAAKGKKK